MSYPSLKYPAKLLLLSHRQMTPLRNLFPWNRTIMAHHVQYLIIILCRHGPWALLDFRDRSRRGRQILLDGYRQTHHLHKLERWRAQQFPVSTIQMTSILQRGLQQCYHNSRYEDGEQEHCLEMWDRDGKGLGWNDTPCSFSTFFICEAWRLISNYYHHKTHPIYYQQWLFLKNNYSMCISQAIKQITWWFSFV